MAPAKDLTLARIAEEIQRAAPHFEVRELPESGYVTVRVRDWVWVYVEPLSDHVRVRFELPDDGMAEQVATRLTCKVAPRPGPIGGRSDSRLDIFVTGSRSCTTAACAGRSRRCWRRSAACLGEHAASNWSSVASRTSSRHDLHRLARRGNRKGGP